MKIRLVSGFAILAISLLSVFGAILEAAPSKKEAHVSESASAEEHSSSSGLPVWEKAVPVGETYRQAAILGWDLSLSATSVSVHGSGPKSYQTQTPRSSSPPAQRRRELPPSAYSKTGYIDNAIVGSQFRFRLDAGFEFLRPDRGEFFYAKCGCYREVGLDPGAPGPAPALGGRDPVTTPFIETELDFVDLNFNFEYAFHPRFSFFLDAPVRSISPQVNEDATGFGDLKLGFKGALVASPDLYLTFQLKGYLPSGDARKGLGTDHGSLEPGLLYYQRVSDRVDLAGELRWWLPIDGSPALGVPPSIDGTTPTGSDDFSSKVVRYGMGVSIDLNPNSSWVIAPVLEGVGWTLSDGFATATVDGTAATLFIEDADRGTIFNLKIGARVSGSENPSSFYVGWGTALTDNAWYDEIVRFEYRYAF